MTPKFPFPNVEGYLSEADKIALRDFAAKCRHLPGVYVEIGSYKGLSALCIACGFDFARTLFCFDLFEPEKLDEFTKNTTIDGKVFAAPIVGDFKGTFNLSSVCFAFVDHSHTLEDTKAAYELLWPRLSKGALLLFHDYFHPDYMPASEFLDTLKHKRVPIEGTGLIVFQKE